MFPNMWNCHKLYIENKIKRKIMVSGARDSSPLPPGIPGGLIRGQDTIRTALDELGTPLVKKFRTPQCKTVYPPLHSKYMKNICVKLHKFLRDFFCSWKPRFFYSSCPQFLRFYSNFVSTHDLKQVRNSDFSREMFFRKKYVFKDEEIYFCLHICWKKEQYLTTFI